MGRPWSGDVKYKNGYEDNVAIKRGIFRKIKGFYSRNQFKLLLKKKDKKVLKNIPEVDK